MRAVLSNVRGLLDIIRTLVRYREWRDGCPDCVSEDSVVDRGNGHLVCRAEVSRMEYRDYDHVTYCRRRWARGEA